MKNDDFNKTNPSELNSSNSLEYSPTNEKETIVNNSENIKNSNFDHSYNEYGGEPGFRSNTTSNEEFDLEHLKDATSSSAGGGAAASAATVSVSAAASIATTALVAIVGGLTLVTTTVTTQVDVQIESIVASYNYINYDITATGDASTLKLSIGNDFEMYEVDLVEGENIGQAANLKPNMDYTITITYDDFLVKTTAYKNVITTLSTKNYVTDPASFNLIYQCQCGVDGYFYFYMDFRDDYNYWSNFEVTLTDDEGNISYCELSDDLFGEQKIKVINYDGKGNDLLDGEATLTVSCDTKESAERLVLYNEKVDI